MYREVESGHTRFEGESTSQAKAVFLDLEGTLVEETAANIHDRHFNLLPGVASALALLKQAGWLLVLVANQPAVGRGELAHDEHQAMLMDLRQSLAEAGSPLDGIYLCLHTPWEACECRKPQPELLFRAARELGIELRASWVIGDRPMDVHAGVTAGCRTIWLTPVYHLSVEDNEAEPDLVCRDLAQAACEILHWDDRSA